MGNTVVVTLKYRLKLLSELTGVDHELSCGNGIYGLDEGSGYQWEVSGMSFQQMRGYVEGLISGVAYLWNIRSFSEEYQYILAKHNLCRKLNITGKTEFLATGIGSCDEWDKRIEEEKKRLIKNGRKRGQTRNVVGG